MGDDSLDKLKPIEKTIDGVAYTFYYLKPRISFAVLSKIVKIIGPALGSTLENVPDEDIAKIKEGDLDVNLGELNFSKVVKLFLENFSTNEVQQIVDTLLEQVLYNKGNVLAHYDDLFTGRLKHLFKVVKIALGVQYADFFEGSSVTSGLLNMVAQARPLNENTIQEI